MGKLKIKRGPGKQRLKGKTVRLAEEVRYIQRRAGQYDARIVTLGQLVLFSAESGDAWLLDPSDQLATPVARDGDPLPVHIEETDTNFAMAWTGAYRIDGPALVYFENDSGKLRTIPRLSNTENHPGNLKDVVNHINIEQGPKLYGNLSKILSCWSGSYSGHFSFRTRIGEL